MLIYNRNIVTRKPPVNLKKEDSELFAHEMTKEIPETILLHLKGVHILYDSVFNLKKLRFYHNYTHWSRISLKAILFRLSLLIKRKMKIEKALWVIDNWSQGYFHWLTDVIPRILVSENILDFHAILLPESYKKHQYISDSIKMLKLPVIYYIPETPLYVEDLILPGHTAETGDYNEVLINKVRQRFICDPQENILPERRIYISREKASRRKVVNELEVIELLKNYNFEIHCFEDYKFDQQIKLMSETKYLVGLHGAGLTNMLFMQKKGKVLEFRNQRDAHNNCYFSLASALELEYYYQLNTGTSAITQVADVTVNLDQLSKNIQLMIAD